MKDLLRLVKKFIILSWRDKILIIRIFLLTAIIRFLILFIPFKRLSKYLGSYNTESIYKITYEEYDEIQRIRLYMYKVAKRTPWESKCLVKAITAQYLLSKMSIGCTLYLGVKKFSDSELKAHAWLRCDDVYVTGGRGEGYIVVGKFCK